MLSVVTADGSTKSGSLIDDIVREGSRRMLAAALEAEVNQYIAELVAETDGPAVVWSSATATSGPAPSSQRPARSRSRPSG